MKKVLQLIIILTLIVLTGGCSKDSNDNIKVEASELETTYLEKPLKGRPKQQTPINNIFIALNTLKEASYYKSESNGEVIAKKAVKLATQKVQNHRIITPDATFNQSTSVSTWVKVAEQTYITDNKVVKREASKVSSADNIKWANKASTLTIEEYMKQYGYSSSDPTRYIINEKTIISDIEIITNGIGRKYTYKFDLDPKISTYYYRENVKNLAGSSSYPEFEKVQMTITFDYKWRMTRIETYEVYKLEMKGLGNVTCEATMTETFKNINNKLNIEEESFFKKYL